MQQPTFNITRSTVIERTQHYRPFIQVADDGNDLLEKIVLESFAHRADEWAAHGFDPLNPTSDAVLAKVASSLDLLLSSAQIHARAKGRDIVLLIDILSAVVSENCKVFPFCGR